MILDRLNYKKPELFPWYLEDVDHFQLKLYYDLALT